MSLQQMLDLPFTDSFSVNIQIRIEQRGREYRGFIQTDFSDWYAFPIELTLYDAKELNTELQKVIGDVSSFFEDGSGDPTERHEALLRLAQKGNYAFKKIFQQGIPRTIIQEALKRDAVIQVTSEDFFIPWELLYDGPLGDQVDASYFWGMQYIISRTLIRDARPGDFISPTIPSRPRIGLIAYRELEHVTGKEIPALQKLEELQQIYLLPLPPLDAAKHDEGLEDFGHFLRQEFQIVHLACHACEKEVLSESYLLISNDFPISIEDIEVQEFEITHKSLVLLNACLSGTVSAFHTSNWAALFWKHGARGVLATEFHVPDWFAAAFIEEVYHLLLSNNPIGRVLLTARRHFWERQQNPLGLGYALYSSPSIRVVS